MPDARGWHLSVAGMADLQYVRTFDTRAAYQLGSVNRLMLETGAPWAKGVVRAYVMASVEPVTLTDRGAPQLLQVAFPSGSTTITDRAHPSPWIMQLAASYEHPLGQGTTLSLYGAAIGAPALGPPAYQHRASAATNPAVPLSHHAQDVTHASFGVLTWGVQSRGVRLEASAFNDRQPGDVGAVFFYRGARLDAYAARATAAAGAWSLFCSYGYLPATSGAHSHDTQHRSGAGAAYNSAMWSLTLVYGGNDPVGSGRLRHTVLAEAEGRSRDGHVVFARVEYVQRTSAELSLVGSVNATQDVEGFQLGYGRAVTRQGNATVRLGAYATVNVVPPQLAPFYGSRHPVSLAAFTQVSWGHRGS